MQEQLYRIVPGDVIYLNNLYYLVESVDGLAYQFQVNTSVVSPGGTADNVSVQTLSPEPGHFYIITGVAVDGLIQVQVQYPQGNNRGTPKNAKILFLDEFIAPRYDPYPVFFIIQQNSYPGLNISAPALWNGSASVWFYGYRVKVKMIAAQDALKQKSLGFNILSGVSGY